MFRCVSTIRSGIIVLLIAVNGLMSCSSNESNKESGEDFSSSKEDTGNNANIRKDEDFTSFRDSDSASKIRGTANADWLLVPGVSAGQTKIGEDADIIYKRLGRPDGGDAAMQKAVAIWYSSHDSTAHSVAIYTARNPDSPATARILQIRVTSPSFITSDGLRTTSSLADIQSKFTVKQTETYEDAAASYKVYDSKEGIAFEVNENNKCVAIIIHKAGVTGEGTYLKFRTTNKFIDKGNG